MKKKLMSALIAIIMLLSLMPAALATEPASQQQIGNYAPASDTDGTLGEPTESTPAEKILENGKVIISKTIAGTETENEFKITLTVKTTEEIKKVTSETADAAVVLVIDISNSMKGNTDNAQMVNAQKAAQAFINSFAPAEGDTSTRKIAIVAFGTHAYQISGWVDASTFKTAAGVVHSTISGINPNINSDTGGTNMHAGLLKASELLNDNAISSISNKNVLLFTDGVPTFYIKGEGEVDGGGNTNFYSQIDHNNHVKVEETVRDNFSGIGKYAVYLGNERIYCKSDRCTLYGYKWNSNHGGEAVSDWLKSLESSDGTSFAAYSTSNASELANIFRSISELIKLKAQAWQLTDPMGDNIEFVRFLDADSNQATQSGGTISWDLKRDIPKVHDAANNVYTYTLSYRIKLNTLSSGFAKDTFYKTNRVTDLTYFIEEQGIAGGLKHAYFNVPSVKGFADDLTFTKVNANKEPLAGAEFKITANDDPDWSKDGTPSEDGTSFTFTGIPSGHTYTLTETKAPVNYVKSGDEYEVIVSYGNVTVKKGNEQVYPVPAGSTSNTFSVVNTRDVTSVTVSKVWDNNGYIGVTHPTGVDVQLYADDVASGSPVTLSASNGVDVNGNWTYTWSNLPKKNASGSDVVYRVEEVSAHNDYTVTYSYLTDGAITITNTYDPNHGKLKITKTFAGSVDSAPDGFEATFTVTGNNYEETINWSDFEDGHYVIEGLNPGTYTVTENITGTSPAYTVATSYKVDNGETDQVTVAAGHTAQLDVTNTYSDNDETISLTVNKVWAGEDTTNRRPPEVEVQLTANGVASNSTATLSEDNSWSYTFDDLPKYANGREVVYGVKEISIVSRYTPSYGSMTAMEGSTKTYTITVTNTYQGVEFAVPVYKVVEGDNAPAETFEFDVKVRRASTDVSGLEVYGTYENAVITAQGANGVAAYYTDGKLTVQTNGKGEYVAWLYFVVPRDEATKFEVAISERDGEAAGWTYDDSQWFVTVDCTGSSPVYTSQKAGPMVISEESVTPPTFTNSYEKPTISTPTPTPRPHRPKADPTPQLIGFIPKSGDMTIWQSILHFLGIR